MGLLFPALGSLGEMMTGGEIRNSVLCVTHAGHSVVPGVNGAGGTPPRLPKTSYEWNFRIKACEQVFQILDSGC